MRTPSIIPLMVVFGSLVVGGLFAASGQGPAGFGLAIGGVLVGFFLSIRRTQPPFEVQTGDAKILMKPIRLAVEELRKLVSPSGDASAFQLVGTEALFEAEEIEKRAAKLVARRMELVPLLRDLKLKQREADELRASTSKSAPAALIAKKEEIEHLLEIQAMIASIDERLKDASASLSSMNSRLKVAAAKMSNTEGLGHEIQDVVGQLRILESSFDEAAELFEEPRVQL